MVSFRSFPSFGGFISVLSLVSVVSFRLFRFVISGLKALPVKSGVVPDRTKRKWTATRRPYKQIQLHLNTNCLINWNEKFKNELGAKIKLGLFIIRALLLEGTLPSINYDQRGQPWYAYLYKQNKCWKKSNVPSGIRTHDTPISWKVL